MFATGRVNIKITEYLPLAVQIWSPGDHGGMPGGRVRDVSPVHCRGHHSGEPGEQARPTE